MKLVWMQKILIAVWRAYLVVFLLFFSVYTVLNISVMIHLTPMLIGCIFPPVPTVFGCFLSHRISITVEQQQSIIDDLMSQFSNLIVARFENNYIGMWSMNKVERQLFFEFQQADPWNNPSGKPNTRTPLANFNVKNVMFFFHFLATIARNCNMIMI